jgi:hypothetical protein
MTIWEERPFEIANLLNPAFCAVLIASSVTGYEKEASKGMPYPLAFFVLPLVLHRSTRDEIPRSIVTRMHSWLQEKPEVRVGFAERMRAMTPFTREAIIFGIQVRALGLNDQGELVKGDARIKPGNWESGAEPNVCRQKAGFVGRWIARAGDLSTIFIMWGVQP